MHDTNGQTPARTITEAVTRVLNESSLAVLATLVEAARGVGAKLLIEESGESAGSLGDPLLDQSVARHAQVFLASRAEAATLRVKEFTSETEDWGEARILFERIEPEPRLVICGAGHVGACLAHLARFVGYHATLIDDRADFVTRARFPEESVELVVAESWTEAVRVSVGRGSGVSVAVVTRGHNEDEECMRAVINTRPDYIGLIGSRRRTNIVLNRLREAGATPEQLREVRAPIGLDIAAVSPQEVALAILAEIVAYRRGGTGLPLSKWRREQ